jgi:ABC-2 type transport system ATP-binding protein
VSAPLIDVLGVSLTGKAGPVFSDLTFSIERDRLTVVVGRSGSGRSALLLAVTGRMRRIRGEVQLGGGPVRPRELRRATSVARLATLVEPEGQLSVGECVLERSLLDDVPRAEAELAMATAEELLEVTFDRTLLVDQLDAYDRSLLCVALATIRPASLLVLDDADRDLDLDDQRRLMAALTRLSAAGHAVLVATTEPTTVPHSAAVVELAPRPEDAAARAAADVLTPTPQKKTA